MANTVRRQGSASFSSEGNWKWRFSFVSFSPVKSGRVSERNFWEQQDSGDTNRMKFSRSSVAEILRFTGRTSRNQLFALVWGFMHMVNPLVSFSSWLTSVCRCSDGWKKKIMQRAFDQIAIGFCSFVYADVHIWKQLANSFQNVFLYTLILRNNAPKKKCHQTEKCLMLLIVKQVSQTHWKKVWKTAQNEVSFCLNNNKYLSLGSGEKKLYFFIFFWFHW